MIKKVNVVSISKLDENKRNTFLNDMTSKKLAINPTSKDNINEGKYETKHAK